MHRRHPPGHGNGAHADTPDVGADAALHMYVQGPDRTILVFTSLPDGRLVEAVYDMRAGEGPEQTCDRIRPDVMARADRLLDGE